MNSVIYTLKTTSIVGKLEKDSNKKKSNEISPDARKV